MFSPQFIFKLWTIEYYITLILKANGWMFTLSSLFCFFLLRIFWKRVKNLISFTSCNIYSQQQQKKNVEAYLWKHCYLIWKESNIYSLICGIKAAFDCSLLVILSKSGACWWNFGFVEATLIPHIIMILTALFYSSQHVDTFPLEIVVLLKTVLKFTSVLFTRIWLFYTGHSANPT